MMKRPDHLQVPDLGVGAGLRIPHYRHVLENPVSVDFFELISENFFVEGGKARYHLEAFRERYPLVLHGVSLNLGGPEEPERSLLDKWKRLVDRVRPAWVSEHLCWCSAGGAHLHDLLPLPYTEEAVRRIARRARRVQEHLEVPFALENTSSYLTYRRSEMSEWEFVRRVVEEADCGLMFDVNNVFVSASNHGFDPMTFIREVPHERIVQIHVAGHTQMGKTIIDTHAGRPNDAVMRLYAETIARTGPVSTLLEWDEHIPPFEELSAAVDDLKKARQLALAGRSTMDQLVRSAPPAHAPLSELQAWMAQLIRHDQALPESQALRELAGLHFTGSGALSPVEQVDIYRQQFWLRHEAILDEDFPGLSAWLGEQQWKSLRESYLRQPESQTMSLGELGHRLAEHIGGLPPFESQGLCVDMARLEWAYQEAFGAADDSPLTEDALAHFSSSDWEGARFRLSSALRLLRLDHPVHDLRRSLRDAPESDDPESERGTAAGALGPLHLVVYRRERELWDKVVPESAFLLLQELARGRSLVDACGAVLRRHPAAEQLFEEELSAWFALWTRLGWIVGVHRHVADEGSPIRSELPA